MLMSHVTAQDIADTVKRITKQDATVTKIDTGYDVYIPIWNERFQLPAHGPWTRKIRDIAKQHQE